MVLDMKKGRSQRPVRVARKIQKMLSELLVVGELSFIVDGVEITEVIMTADLRIARIYVLSRDMAACQDMVTALNHKSREIRFFLSKGIEMKYAPQILFYVDKSLERDARIDRLLRNIDNVNETKPR